MLGCDGELGGAGACVVERVLADGGGGEDPFGGVGGQLLGPALGGGLAGCLLIIPE